MPETAHIPTKSRAQSHLRPLPSALKNRIDQLNRDGLLDFYRPVEEEKTNIYPAYEVRPPKPMLRAFGGNPGFVAKHDGIKGTVPASGFYTFTNCFISKNGTVLDKQRRIFFSEDLTSSYWMWFLGKLINHTVLMKTSSGQTSVARFIGGCNQLVRHLDQPSGTLVNLAKPGPKVYGHWILDVLPMLFNFLEIARAGTFKRPYKFLLSEATPPWAKCLLHATFGITEKDIVLFNDDREVLHVDSIVVPSLMRVSPLISPRMNIFVGHVLKLLNLDQAPRTPRLPQHIFVSRENFANDENRLLVNYREVVEAVKEMGFVAVAPEQLRWIEQLRLFSQAAVVMGEYGSGIHNTIFSPASTLSIVMTNLKSNWNQSSIAALRGQETIYVRPSMQERVGKANGIRYEFDINTLRDAMELALTRKSQ